MKIPFTDVESHLSAGLESVSYIVGIAKHGIKLIVILDIEKLMSNSLTISQLGS
jgi:chemotaxis signal transduction protein